MGFPGSSAGKEFACNAGDPGLIPGSGKSFGGGHGNPENAYGQRSLAGYSPWDHKESDTTKQLSTAQASYTEQDSLVNPKTAHNLLRDKEGPPD